MKQIIKPSLHHLMIRGADYEDADRISRLIARNVRQIHTNTGLYSDHQIRLWQDGYIPSIIKTHIQSRLVFVLEYGALLCGTIQLDLKHPEIKGFYLDPDYTDKGLGNVLFGFVISYLKMNRCQYIELTSNRLARPFYEKQQFQVVGKEIVYWQGEPFEEWRMRRSFKET